VSALYVIASRGHCVINGLGEVKVFESFDDAVIFGASMIAEGKDLGSFRVQKVHLVKEGGE
jgi:hypothetical protein